jgi:hypothetical protein
MVPNGLEMRKNFQGLTAGLVGGPALASWAWQDKRVDLAGLCGVLLDIVISPGWHTSLVHQMAFQVTEASQSPAHCLAQGKGC